MNLDEEVGLSSQSADRGSMELAMEVVTAKRACSQQSVEIYVCKGSFVRPLWLWTEYLSAHGAETWKYVQYEEKEKRWHRLWRRVAE